MLRKKRWAPPGISALWNARATATTTHAGVRKHIIGDTIGHFAPESSFRSVVPSLSVRCTDSESTDGARELGKGVYEPLSVDVGIPMAIECAETARYRRDMK